MKTRVLRTVCFVFIGFLMNGFITKAQEPFYDTEWKDGKMVLRTKYVMNYFSLYERESVSKYTYDESGNFLKKEVYAWNKKYEWNDKLCKYYPDYSENKWTPLYCILKKEDLASNFVSMELLYWNQKKKTYNAPAEAIIFQLDNPNYFNYLAFQKGDKYNEVVNNINYSRELLAKLAE